MAMMFAKLKILSSLCFNSFLTNNIHVEGIKDIDKEDIENASNLVIKSNYWFF